MRTVIISDIHGESAAFQELLEQIGFDRRENQLILLGDALDGGADACGTYFKIRALKEEMGERLVYIRGEHEQMFMDAELLTRGQLANAFLWQQNGGKETLAALKRRKVSAGKTAAWLRDNTRLWYEEQDFICVHGDIRDEVVWNNSQETFLWGNEGVHSNNYAGKLAIVGHTELEMPVYLDGSGTESSFHPNYGTWFELPGRGMIAMDTGCGYGGALTAMLIEHGWMRFERSAG
ncbi:serine/threonine protein phosphatase 1 [Moryella indoligenes]|uniref:Serine/threonine protein phosphatase 1 n=1 Tax=Moryella indoligenes TaxID=371674 RepID=A0AAE4AL13_9FIRM|nr:metallophosphoesterase [Moryella indoligenes]MDQ0152650.1 serine/threonine protein phosphatase 1 [Moryella indoligenes]